MASTNYFKKFGYINYNYNVITNLLKRFELINLGTLLNSKIYLPYLISEGETPENIALAYYGDTSYFWMVLLPNNIRNVYEEWPRSQEVFDEYIVEKYGSLDYAKSVVDHYEDNEGNWVSNTNDLTTSTGITIYDYENILNEKKRIINLIRVEYKNQLEKEFKKIFS